ncbi:hypothetical protein QZH41_017610 [Actinostola sp. cb2023]|nr:hypothetical protein QZH41_017610 [Actinostola sp. cb2023]
MVLLMDRRMLNTACNVLLFSLAVTDMLTGLSLFFTPNYIIGPNAFSIPEGIAGDMFCRLIYSQCIVFTLGIVSVYTLTCMAVERWYAVSRPHKYKLVFSKNKKYIYVAIVWFLSCVLNSPHALEMELAINNSSQPECVWVTAVTNKQARQTVAFLEFLGKYFLPVSITCATFISLMMTVRKPNSVFLRRHGNAGVRLLRMCTFTAFILAFCWFPNQFYYLLFKFNVTQLNVPWHHVTVVLCMFNSCVNPWVYYATNKTYRRKLVSLLRKCFPKMGECEGTTSGSAGFDGSTATGKDIREVHTLSTARSSSCNLEKIKHFDNEAITHSQSDDLEVIELSKQQPLVKPEADCPQFGRVSSPSSEDNVK